MTKEEKIKEAWGIYSYLGSVIDENGWVSTKYLPEKQCVEFNNNTDLEYDIELGYRPKSLQGIGDNNGWIKIESEDDLPKDYAECYFITKYDECEFRRGFFCNKSKNFYENYSYSFTVITHYQPIEKPKPPIY